MAAPTLFNYLTTTRFLLHDPNSKNFSDPQLINAINLARDQICGDISSPQAIISVPLVTGQEAYTFNTLLSGVQNLGLPARAVQAVLGVNFVQATNLKIPLLPLPWSTLNDSYRATPINSLPEAFSVPDIGGPLSSLYIGPPPSTGTWTMEVRVVWLGNALSSYTDVEGVISSPLADSLVPILASKWSWSFNDDEEQADKFEAKYERVLAKMAAGMPPFSAIPYSSIY